MGGLGVEWKAKSHPKKKKKEKQWKNSKTRLTYGKQQAKGFNNVNENRRSQKACNDLQAKWNVANPRKYRGSNFLPQKFPKK